MLKNTVSSLAILTSIWRVKKRDYIENFIPFIATLIRKNNYKSIETGTVCRDFEEEFGLSVPFHPMQMILVRAKKRGIIAKRYNRFIPVFQKVSEYEFSSTAKDQMRQQEKLISEIISYAADKYKYEMSRERADYALISFLKDYDLEILFAAEDKGMLPEVSSSKQDKFIIYSFIKKVYESEPELFEFVVNIAIGNLMANSILYRDYNKFVSKLKTVCFYLDTRFVFRLIGLEGDERTAVYEEFIKTLVKEGACIKIFRHTYEEASEILENCLDWVENPRYDPSRATNVLRFFV